MSSTYGENLKLSIFGQSHGAAIGMTLDGIPAGLPGDTDALHAFLNRRAPGQNDWSTPRKEADRPEFLSGILDGCTCGAPIAAAIYNKNTRSGDYANLKDCPRPGHADFTAQIKYGGFQDAAGGGHFSGRLTAPLCIAGGLCKQWLEGMGIQIFAHISAIAGISDTPFDPLAPDMDSIQPEFPVINPDAGARMRAAISAARSDGDSVGGIVECAVTGLPASISRSQQSVSLSKGEMQELIVKGRHDPCIVPRAVPVIEAAAAIAIFDMILGNTRTDRRKP